MATQFQNKSATVITVVDQKCLAIEETPIDASFCCFHIVFVTGKQLQRIDAKRIQFPNLLMLGTVLRERSCLSCSFFTGCVSDAYRECRIDMYPSRFKHRARCKAQGVLHPTERFGRVEHSRWKNNVQLLCQLHRILDTVFSQRKFLDASLQLMKNCRARDAFVTGDRCLTRPPWNALCGRKIDANPILPLHGVSLSHGVRFSTQTGSCGKKA